MRFVAVELPERTVAVPWPRLRVGDEGRLHLDAPTGDA